MTENQKLYSNGGIIHIRDELSVQIDGLSVRRDNSLKYKSKDDFFLR